MGRPRKPENQLRPAGRELWDSVVGEYDLDVHERLILLEACRTVDRLHALDEELQDAPLTVFNNKGDEVPNPRLTESRQQQGNLTRLIASLRLPSGEESDRPQRRGAARGAYGIRGAVS